MLLTKDHNSVNFQKQRNLVNGDKVIKDGCTWSKVGLHSDSKRVDAHWEKNVKGTNKRTSILCRHVLTGRIKAHKICFKNYECYHCAYDQMIEDEDMELLEEKQVC